MRRMIALIVLWAGLLGAGSPALACATAGAAGDCCPPGAPSGCSQGFEQLDVAATACCVTGSASSPIASAESSRGSQHWERDCGAADPVVIADAFDSLQPSGQSSGFDTAIIDSALPDRSLTYLHTGRLRL